MIVAEQTTKISFIDRHAKDARKKLGHFILVWCTPVINVSKSFSRPWINFYLQEILSYANDRNQLDFSFKDLVVAFHLWRLHMIMTILTEIFRLQTKVTFTPYSLGSMVKKRICEFLQHSFLKKIIIKCLIKWQIAASFIISIKMNNWWFKTLILRVFIANKKQEPKMVLSLVCKKDFWWFAICRIKRSFQKRIGCLGFDCNKRWWNHRNWHLW